MAAISTKSALAGAAATIRNEHADKANTATRIGDEFIALIASSLLCENGERNGMLPSASAATNTTALQAALTNVDPGGVVFIFSPGVYQITSITLSGGRKIRMGDGVTLQWAANTGTAMFTVSGSYCGIIGGKLDGNASNQSGSVEAVVFSSGPGFVLDSVEVTNFKYRFLLTDEGGELSPGGRVLNCAFHDCGTVTNCDVLGIRSSRWFVGSGTSFKDIGDGHCIRLGLYTDNAALGPVRDTRIIGVHFQDTQHVGVTCELHTRGAVIDACTFRNLEQGVKTEIQSKGTYDITVSNCEFRTLTGTDSCNMTAPQCTFVNNRCYDWAGGLTLNSYATVRGNYFDNCGTLAGTQATIHILTSGGFAPAGTFDISGNTILNAPYRGIIASAGGCRIIGNYIKSSAQYGCQVGGSGNEVIGNVIDTATFCFVFDTTMTGSVVTDNNVSNGSSGAVSFTNNASFMSVRFERNNGITPAFSQTVATGVVTAGLSQGQITLDTEGGAATDDLDTITATSGIARGHVIVLGDNADARDVTVKHNTGNIILAGAADFAMLNTNYKIALMWSGTKWQELWRATA